MEQRNLTLLTDLYELTMMQGYFKEKDANETVVSEKDILSYSVYHYDKENGITIAA